MRLTASCPNEDCNEKNVIEIETKDAGKTEVGVPRPNLKDSGVVQFSLSHRDHTLVIDVDNSGTIRKYLTIPKVDTIVDHYVATVANRIRQHSIKFHTLLVLSPVKMWREFYINVGSALLSLFDSDLFNMTVESNRLVAQYSQFKVMISSDINVLNTINSNVSLIIDQSYLKNQETIKVIADNINVIDIIGISLDQKHLFYEPGKEIENVDIIISNWEVGSVFYMVPDLESVGLFSLEILDNLPF